MRIEDLVEPIRVSKMSYEDLIKRVRGIRHDRANYVPPVVKKKATKSKASRKTKVDKLVVGMSDEERADLIKMLKE